MKKGQRVLVWSLQSFSGGGFLCGEPAFVSQSDTDGGSVLLSVMRKINGRVTVDNNYEVYRQQLRIVDKENWPACYKLRKFRKAFMRGDFVQPTLF